MSLPTPRHPAEQLPVSVQWRCWPPPELLDVPRAYVIHKLREVAGKYWEAVNETSNCTLVVPYYRPQGISFAADAGCDEDDCAVFSGPLEGAAPSCDTTVEGRRGSEADVLGGRVLLIRAHYEYFSEQSQLLRDAFSGALPANLARPSFTTPTCRGGAPRAIASAPDDLRLWLPLPDPVSFPYVVHFIYFGDFDLILRILCARPSHVMGLWKNALYLKLEELVHWMKIQIFDEEDDIIEEENEDAPSGPPSPTATGTDEETSDVEMSGP